MYHSPEWSLSKWVTITRRIKYILLQVPFNPLCIIILFTFSDIVSYPSHHLIMDSQAKKKLRKNSSTFWIFKFDNSEGIERIRDGIIKCTLPKHKCITYGKLILCIFLAHEMDIILVVSDKSLIWINSGKRITNNCLMNPKEGLKSQTSRWAVLHLDLRSG